MVGNGIEVCVDCLRDFGRAVQPAKHQCVSGENNGIGRLRIDEEFDERFGWTQPRSNQRRTCRVDDVPCLPITGRNFKRSDALLRVKDLIQEFLAILP